MTRMSVKFRGLDRLQSALGRVPDGFNQFVKDIITSVEGDARRGAKPHSGDTGELARSIKSEVKGTPMPLSGRVYTNKDYAPYAEEGRKPGRMPPVSAIAEWARRHGIGIAPFVLARAIARRGTKGIFFMKRAVDNVKAKMPALTAGAEQRIRRDWE